MDWNPVLENPLNAALNIPLAQPTLAHRIFSWFEKQSFRMSRVIVVSESEAIWARSNLGIDPIVIHNPIPDLFFCETAAEKENLILFAASFIPIKGSDFFPEILSVLDEYPDWKFAIVEYPYEDPRIIRLPRLSKTELCKIYQRAQVVFAPSVYESFHLVITESLASGCAVVTTREGIANEIESNLFIAEFELESLRNALIQAINSTPVPVGLEQFRESAYAQKVLEVF
jgi:glycosyltransferase involved in cell wall biosynthesis